MFDFLFLDTSRKQKTEILKRIIDGIPIDFYNKSLYISSIDILSDSEFEVFYMKITNSIVPDTEKKFIVKPFTLPWINSI